MLALNSHPPATSNAPTVLATSARPSLLAPLLVLALASCTLLLGLGWPRLWDRDEPRNAGCTVEMLDRADWIVPMFNSELRTHKPILLYWLQMVAYQVTGANEWGARLPSSLLMMGTILCAMLLSARLLNNRFLRGKEEQAPENFLTIGWYRWNSPAMWTGMILATSLMVIVAGRAATPDSPLIFCSTLAITFLVFALTCQPSHKRQSWLYFILGYTALGLGVLAKGPVGFILPITVVSAWFQWERISQDDRWVRLSNQASTLRQWRVWLPSILVRLSPRAVWDYLFQTKLLIGVPLVLAVALPWYLWVGIRTEGRWLREFFWEHNVQRAVQSMEGHQGGVWYYPIAMLVGLFPWSLWLAPFSVWLWKLNPLGLWISAPQTNKEDSELSPKKLRINSLARLSLIWVAVYVGAFSCANTKLPSYITPCYPGAALTLGLFFACLANNPGQLSFQQLWNAWRSRAMRYATLATLITSLLTGIGASLALAMIAYQEKMYQVVWQSLWGIALSCAAIAALDAWRKNMVQRIPICFAAGSLICMSGWMVGGAATASRYRLDLNALQQIQSDHPEQRWLAVGILEPSWIFYTQHSIPEIPIASSQSPASGTLAQSASGHSLPWTQQVVAHWEQNPNLGIITLDCWANELKQYLNEHSESRLKSYQMVRQDYPYFLRHQPLCLLLLQRADISPDATAEKSPPASTDFRR